MAVVSASSSLMTSLVGGFAGGEVKFAVVRLKLAESDGCTSTGSGGANSGE